MAVARTTLLLDRWWWKRRRDTKSEAVDVYCVDLFPLRAVSPAAARTCRDACHYLRTTERHLFHR
jgi:hypothetical protein